MGRFLWILGDICPDTDITAFVSLRRDGTGLMSPDGLNIFFKVAFYTWEEDVVLKSGQLERPFEAKVNRWLKKISVRLPKRAAGGRRVSPYLAWFSAEQNRSLTKVPGGG